eukprot:TRINITY_DN10834_c0_g1_i1.p1 TRINITY_DN10834_c0_g1~~TRINITY_DN10834_c0_g1_i1.p1  ORF type:complete len:463 (+),score=182.94 TRINITY_DN10834_c0_g1_i1:67-1455(+)
MDTLKFNRDSFLCLLEKLIGETKYLQNNPPNHIPEEDRAGKHVLDVLIPLTNGEESYEEIDDAKIKIYGKLPGLRLKHIHFEHELRGNIIIEYTSSENPSKVFGLVGSHLDVVVADPEVWERDPFTLYVEDDMIYGRGTTDCLGHVALQVNIFEQLAQKNIDSQDIRFGGVIITDEEGGHAKPPCGVTELSRIGLLDSFKDGPIIWLDCADFHPNIGSGGVVQWKITAKGEPFHSGFPHKGINAIELANDAVQEIQQAFYENFPPHEDERPFSEGGWGFESCSSMKPTRALQPIDSSTNSIPGLFCIMGDIRLTPFYSITDAMKVVEDRVKELNETKFKSLEENTKRGPSSKYTLYDEEGNETIKGSIELEWISDYIKGVACSIDSKGFKLICDATQSVLGECKPYSDTGSLPLVADLKEAGFDLQMNGFGLEDYYHCDNEQARISHFDQGFQILVHIMNNL